MQYHGTWENGYRHGNGVEEHASSDYKVYFAVDYGLRFDQTNVHQSTSINHAQIMLDLDFNVASGRVGEGREARVRSSFLSVRLSLRGNVARQPT